MFIKTEKIIGGLIVVCLVGSFIAWVLPPKSVDSATVVTWGTIAETLTCNYSTANTGFGTLSSAAISSLSFQATSTVNNAFYWKVSSTGDTSDPGIYNSTGTIPNLLGSADQDYENTTTCTVGSWSECFGMQAATTTIGSGQALKMRGSRYAYKTGNAIGGFELAASQITFASTSAAGTDREVNFTLKVTVKDDSAAGDYKDTLTFTCTSTP